MSTRTTCVWRNPTIRTIFSPVKHNPIVLKGKAIHLRTIRKKDLDSIYDLMVDIESRGPWFPLNFDSESTFLEKYEKTGFWSDERGILLIVDNTTERVLGQMVFFRASAYYDAFELGYQIYDPKDRGKGITTDAVNTMVKYLFDWKPIHRLQLQLVGENISSQRVAEKCGFRHEGTARAAVMGKGKPVDLEVYSITRADFESLASVISDQ